jgi:hypothetical protein
MLIALAWLAIGAAEKFAVNQQCWSSTQLTIPYYASPTPSLLIELNFPTTLLQTALPNSSITPFFRLTKPPHPLSFQTDIFHNCSSIPSHNLALPIGLHAHLVTTVTQASLHNISHTHPCNGNARVAATETKGPIKQTWFSWSVSIHKVGWPIFTLQVNRKQYYLSNFDTCLLNN